MTDGVNTWNVESEIPIELFITDPQDGSGLAGQVPFISLDIQRTSDNRYWTGTFWSTSFSTLSMSEPDSTNQPGRYTYVLSAVANPSSERYIVHAVVNNPPLLDGAEAYEVHVSRPLDVHIYESQPCGC